MLTHARWACVRAVRRGAKRGSSGLISRPALEERLVDSEIFCSPCLHHIDFAPCLRNNICMKQHLGLIDIARCEDNGWSIDRDTSLP